MTKDQQGKKLGLRIIEALDYVAKKVGCYKVYSTAIRYSKQFFGLTYSSLTYRRSLTAPTRTKDSTSNAATSAWGLKWHTITIEIDYPLHRNKRSCETQEEREIENDFGKGLGTKIFGERFAGPYYRSYLCGTCKGMGRDDIRAPFGLRWL